MLRSVVVVLSMIISLTVQADDQARLDQIKAEIKKLQSWLTEAREEHDDLQQRLRKSDQEIAAQIKEIEATRARLREEQIRLKKLQAEQAQRAVRLVAGLAPGSLGAAGQRRGEKHEP